MPITPTVALGVAFDIIDAAGQRLPRRQRGTATERVETALAVADWLMTHLGPGKGTLDVAESTPAGPARRVECAASPGDHVYVRAGKTIDGRPFVAFSVVVDGNPSDLALTPADARRLAAGILDAADEADGTSPLTFLGGAESPKDGDE